MCDLMQSICSISPDSTGHRFTTLKLRAPNHARNDHQIEFATNEACVPMIMTTTPADDTLRNIYWAMKNETLIDPSRGGYLVSTMFYPSDGLA